MKKIAWLLMIVAFIGGANYLWHQYRAWDARVTAENLPDVHAVTGVLDAGDRYILAMTTQGELYGWGDNKYMQLGMMDSKSAPVPRKMASDLKWRYVATGNDASYAISRDGLGWRREFSKGQQSSDPELLATYVDYQPLDPAIRWRVIRVSPLNSVGIDSNGRLWVWNEQAPKYSPWETTRGGPLFNFIPVAPQQQWRDVCLTGQTLYAIAADGSLWKKVGNFTLPTRTAQSAGDDVGSAIELTKQTTQTHFRRVVCRDQARHVLFIDAQDRLWGFGPNDFGELGDGDGDRFTPSFAVPEAQMKQLTDKRWADIAIGPGFTLGIAIDGSLWGWGNNIGGKLGIGSDKYTDIPTLADNTRTWIAVAASYVSGVGLTSSGKIYTWGDNGTGILGEGGAARYRVVPTPVFSDQVWGINFEAATKK